MKISSLIEVISAAHLTAYVEGPFPQRGGIMLVAPPSTFKTSIVKMLEVYPNSRVLSDINVKTLGDMHADLSHNIYSTLAFTEFEKLYQRHDSTASNIEGTLKALVEEGFRHSSYQDQRMVVRQARCLLVCAMTTNLYQRKFTQWKDDGFLRRFVWCHFALSDPFAVLRAIDAWIPLDIYGSDPLVFGLPQGQRIPYSVNPRESKAIQRMLAHHMDPATPFILLKKIYCVLLWRYPRADGGKAWLILSDFAECLTSNGADLDLEEGKRPGPRSRARASNAEFDVRAREALGVKLTRDHNREVARKLKKGRKKNEVPGV